QRLDELGELRGESFRLVAREPIDADGATSSAGAATRLKVQMLPTLLDVAVGSYYVSLEQPLGNLAVAALDPESPASFAANGVVAEVEHEARILGRPAIRTSAVP
ncbi:MAG: peptidase M14, partial [Rhizobacter sp.]|nr:peptidase M14 [Rhizobacter sp.]